MSLSRQEWNIILYQQDSNQVVLYHPHRNIMITTSVDPSSLRVHHAIDYPHLQQYLGFCALCKRPFDQPPFHDFMHQSYFRFLADSFQLPDSQEQEHDSFSNTTPRLNSHFNTGYYEKFFREEKKIGRGYRGSVFLCTHVLDSISIGTFAVKKIPVGDNHEWLLKTLSEVTLLEKLRHENIVDYKHAWIEETQLHRFAPSIPCLFVLMEYANAGNLEELITNPSIEEDAIRNKTRSSNFDTAFPNQAFHQGGIGYAPFARKVLFLDSAQIQKFLSDVVHGLEYLHSFGIIHRDLKPSNLLLTREENGETRILISDFGESEVLNHIDPSRTGCTGTVDYMAPEFFMPSAPKPGQKGDMWSLGMLLYYMCYSFLPYESEDVDELKKEIQEKEIVYHHCDRIGEVLLAIMKDLLVPWEQRVYCKDLLRKYHDFFQNQGATDGHFPNDPCQSPVLRPKLDIVNIEKDVTGFNYQPPSELVILPKRRYQSEKGIARTISSDQFKNATHLFMLLIKILFHFWTCHPSQIRIQFILVPFCVTLICMSLGLSLRNSSLIFAIEMALSMKMNVCCCEEFSY